MKLERLALIAEIVSGIAIVVTLIVLIIEVRDNTNAVRADTRQSIAERVERILLTVATDDELADLMSAAVAGDLELVDDLRVRAFILTLLRNAEEAYLQVLEGRLDYEYLEARLQSMFFVLASGAGAAIYAEQKAGGVYNREFIEALDRAMDDWRRRRADRPDSSPQ